MRMTVKERLHKIVESLPDEMPDAAIDETEIILRRYAGDRNGIGGAATVEEVLERLHSELSPEEIESLPTDLAANVDHYAYGLPKRPAAAA